MMRSIILLLRTTIIYMYTYIVVVDYYPYPAYPSLARAFFFNLNSPTFAMNIQIDSAF